MPTTTGAASPWCRCPSPRATSRSMPGGTARVALRQLAPKPYSIERVETLPAIERFLKATGDCEIAWLSDGVDTGRGPEFLEGLGKTIGDRALTIFEGGTPSAARSGRGRKRRGEDDREGAAHRWRRCRRHRARARPEGLADRRGPLRFCAAGSRDRSRVRSSGRIAQRHRAARNLRRTIRRRGATARQALAPARDRHRQRIDQRYRAAAAGIDVLSHPRAGAVRRRAARRSRRAATGDHAISRPEAADDRAGGCRHAVARNSRAHQRLDRARRRAGALCRAASGAGR